MAVEISQEVSISKQPDSLPRSGVILDTADPGATALSREDRIRLYYAGELADGNLDALLPRYRTPEDGSAEEPWMDILVADPLSDSQIGVLASMISAARGETEGGK